MSTAARRLDVYRIPLQLIATCQPHGSRLQRFDRRVGAQLTESLASTLQNLAEAMRPTGKDRTHFLTVALGSCDEVRALLEAAVAFLHRARRPGTAPRVGMELGAQGIG